MTMYFEPFTFTLEQLTSFMESEFKVLSIDMISTLDSLRKELQMVESYLMDVDEIERRETSLSHVLASQLQHLREIALDIEDLLDVFFKEVEEKSKGSMWKKLKSIFSTSNPLLRTHQVVEKVEKLKEELKETINRPKGYQLPTNYHHLVKPRRRPQTYPYMTTIDDFIVGLEDDIRSLVAILAGKKDTTMAVVGTGGSGHCSRFPFSMASSEASLNPFAITGTGVETNPITDSKLNTNLISEPTPKKTNRGRIKIPIEKILNKNKKHVTFSKRRKGLFKKASELCVLCDVSVAIVTFSEAGKVYAFGHPTTDAVIHRYLHGGDGGSSSEHGGAIENPFEDPRMPWWERPIEELGLQELESFGEALKQTMCNLERRITQLDYESQSECKAAVKFDFDYDLRLNQAGMEPAICNQMNCCCYNDLMNCCYNDYHHMDGVGAVDTTISFLSPEFHSVASQYDQSDINSIVAMANFNRSNSGYGGF